MRNLVPEDLSRRSDPAVVRQRSITSLTRAALASARAVFTSENNPSAIVARTWPNDELAALLVNRGATPITTTANTAVLATTIVADLLSSLGPVSVGGTLLGQGLQLSFKGAAVISIPALITDANHASFVAEGAPIPVYALHVGTPTLMAPRKIAALWTLTREMIDGSNAEALTTENMKRSAGLKLDDILFDANAGDEIRPPGLRHNIPPLTASTAPGKTDAMLDDVAALLAAVDPIGGPVTLIAKSSRAKMMPALSRGGTLPEVLGSPMVDADVLIAVATDGLVSATDGVPEVRSSREATVHEESSPGALMTGGPVRSMFQTDSVSQRLTLDATWAVRDDRAVAWLTTAW